jgi:hypothetical protein
VSKVQGIGDALNICLEFEYSKPTYGPDLNNDTVTKLYLI